MNDLHIIDIKNVSKEFDGKSVVDNISLYIRKGEFLTLLGPSGCGKTTTLRMIAGFERPTTGTITLKGKPIDDIPPHLRPVNTVFQRYALFPNLNVYGNIAFGLKLKRIQTPVLDASGQPVLDRKGNPKYKKVKLAKDVIDKKIRAALKTVNLTGYEDRDVNSLSGGQQQRVAIARAIVNEPEVLLLDEPLGALDLKMRKEMQLELKEMHDKIGITFIYVTHDQEEALTMSDTVVVMRDGSIQQIGTPSDIYNEPKNAFVANFIGDSNILDGIMNEDALVTFDGAKFECVDKGFQPNEPVDVVLRPEDIYLVEENDNAPLSGEITGCTFKGVHFEMWVKTKNGCEIMVHDTSPWEIGKKVSLYIKPFDIHIMKKTRHANVFPATIVENGMIEISGDKFPADTYQLFPDVTVTDDGKMWRGEEEVDPTGIKVEATIPFDKIELMDNEDEGVIGGDVAFIMFKGTHNFIEVKSARGDLFTTATQETWDDGDRVGIAVDPRDIRLKIIEDNANEEN